MEGKNNVGGRVKFWLILRMSLITFFLKKSSLSKCSLSRKETVVENYSPYYPERALLM